MQVPHGTNSGFMDIMQNIVENQKTYPRNTLCLSIPYLPVWFFQNAFNQYLSIYYIPDFIFLNAHNCMR